MSSYSNTVVCCYSEDRAGKMVQGLKGDTNKECSQGEVENEGQDSGDESGNEEVTVHDMEEVNNWII